MNPIDDFFEIKIEKSKMQATLFQSTHANKEIEITIEDIKDFIKETGIIYGVKGEALLQIITGNAVFPLIIAEGVYPINGEDAKLKIFFPNSDKIQHKDELRNVDLKQVINIPSVTQGQLIGEKIPATDGISGKNVFGEDLPAKRGKDFRLRAGKNTRIDQEGLKLFATIDGQVSVESKTIHVYPIFEVNGDLDLHIGNITFVGTVNIRGNVPGGFEIKAKGDVKIHGTVENATIESEGSIFVSAGIFGQGKGLLKAKGDLYTSFINQGNVEVEGDVTVAQAILHSNVQAGGNVYCHKGKGNIVGGYISAGKNIVAKEIGNIHNTKTSLYLGIHQSLIEKEKKYNENVKRAEEELIKLNILLKKIEEKEKQSVLSANEKIMKLRVRNTIVLTAETLLQAKEKLEDFHEISSQYGNSTVIIEKQIFPNVDLNFGKYRRKIINPHQYSKIFLENSEIVIVPK